MPLMFANTNCRIKCLCIFRDILKDPVMSQYAETVELFANSERQQEEEIEEILPRLLDSYAALSKEILNAGGDISEHLRTVITDCSNPFVEKCAKGESLSEEDVDAIKREINLLDYIPFIGPLHFKQFLINYYDESLLPSWKSDTAVSYLDFYLDYLKNIRAGGFGIFSRYMGFIVDEDGLIPVKNLDDERLSDLYGYETERKKLYDNTLALVNEKEAANILLYGDAGTGKSSSIKACAREFYDQGLRIVEFTKETLHMIPEISGQLSTNPLKFIFFIDDLSFSQGDEGFCYLKGLLEGSIAKRPSNIVVYATSNRRHLIEENQEERKGGEVHVNDVLQQNTSLSARFGITITFSRPKKDLYLEIVDSLADKEGLTMDRSLLHQSAEAFAIQQGGRTPRAAKQFVNLVSNNVL